VSGDDLDLMLQAGAFHCSLVEKKTKAEINTSLIFVNVYSRPTYAFAAPVMMMRFAVQALKRRASRRASAADGGAPLVAGLARAPMPNEASYLLTLLEASNQGESGDGLTLPHTLEQLGDASLQAALDAFTAADAH